jgi:uncharacterized protein (TIGR00297 family)
MMTDDDHQGQRRPLARSRPREYNLMRPVKEHTRMEYVDNLIFGLALSAIIAVLAYRRGSLSESGAVGAMIDGTLIFGLGGWVWGLTLITFFVSSSALSHYKEAAKENLAEKFAKGHRRDLAQTLANGGAGALLAVAYGIWGEPAVFAAFLGAMATVNADTWATELGVLNPTPPRLITSGQVVEVGTSGGVSRLGIAASAAGALVIGLGALIFATIDQVIRDAKDPLRFAWVVPVALLGGMVGSTVDSLLGASVQAIYHCPACAKETEKRIHGCGTGAEHTRGWRWLNNDMVNFISSWAGALTAAVLFLF